MGSRKYARSKLLSSVALVVLLSGCSDARKPGGVGPTEDCECPSDRICVQGRCEKSRACELDSECSGSRCVAGSCQSNIDVDGQCVGVAAVEPAFAADAFTDTVLKCSWTNGSAASAPIVVDLDGDGMPEIVARTFEAGQLGLTAIRGDTCAVVWQATNPAEPSGSHQLAAADLDGDGTVEVLDTAQYGGVHGEVLPMVWNSRGRLVNIGEPGILDGMGGAIGIANLDGVGDPEVVYHGSVWRFDGSVLQPVHIPSPQIRSQYTVLADVDLDGTVEGIVGSRIVDLLTGVDETPAGMPDWTESEYYPAVAQIDPSTPEPEIVLSGNQRVHVIDARSGAAVFGPVTLPAAGGGPPAIADFDGDGKLEIAVVWKDGIGVIDRDCVGAEAAGCAADGLRWMKSIAEASSSTSVVAFDFNGDGRAEIVHADECWLRIIDGRDGRTLSAKPLSSSTGREHPVVADVDGDGHAEIVAGGHGPFAASRCGDARAQESGVLPTPSWQRGIFVYEDPQERFLAARPIWNQHGYHASNILDDRSVPVEAAGQFGPGQGFRLQQSLEAAAETELPDLVARRLAVGEDCDAWELTAEVCNRGGASTLTPVAATFYGRATGATAPGEVMCVTRTAGVLGAGGCEAVSCVASGTAQPLTLTLLSDDDGSGLDSVAECNEDNNAASLDQAACGLLK